MFSKKPKEMDDKKKALNARLESIGMASFLIIMGILLMMPQGAVPQSAWLIVIGVVFLSLAGVRFYFGIPVYGVGIIIGVVAIVFGLGGALGVTLPLFPLLLILFGISILLKPRIERK